MTAARSGIYKIINKVNGKYYVGSSKDLRGISYGRWKTHVCKLNGGRHPNAHLQSAWKKYGKNNFDFQIVEETNNLIVREQYYLDIALSEKENCYNLTFTAYQVKMTPHLKDKISKSLIGRFRGNLNPNYGKKHSAETRKKLSIAHLGKPSPNKGKEMSAEQKVKISNTLLQKRNEISERLAKDWKFVSPDKKIIEVHNLSDFCNKNNLNVSHMWSVFKGIRLHHKGWTKIS